MKKKILAAVMAATMVFSLVACGSSDAGSNAATGSASATTGSENAGTESASAGTTSSSCLRRSDQGRHHQQRPQRVRLPYRKR